MKNQVYDKFCDVFGSDGDIRTFFAPGRVNLIGEHTDYNGGHVLPCALSIGTYAAVRLRNDKICRFFSINFEKDGIIESSISDLSYDKSKLFCNYPLGVVWALEKNGFSITCGFDIVYYGDIPYCSGLSSSASVEVLTAFTLKTLFNFDFDGVKLAQMCRQAESEFVGVNCGIMDQFISSMGKKNHAVFLDTASLDFEYIPVELGNCSLIIACSNKKRGLGDSKYNERRAECEKAAMMISAVRPLNFLGDLTADEFEEFSSYISDPICRRRAKHAVLENLRTVKACELLKSGDIEGFGVLMNESHVSLKEDYEVTGTELDTLVETSWKQPGVLGSRMTGAGFGGCTVSIVKKEFVDSFISNVGDVYLEKIGYAADFYTVEIGDGPQEI